MQTPERRSQLANAAFASLFAVVLTAAATIALLRVPSGLPFLLDPDEQSFVKPAVHILTQGNINPHWFGHPGTVTIYLMSIAFAIYGRLGMAVGWFSGLKKFVAFYSYDPSSFHLIGRVLIVVSFLLSLIALFQLSRTVTNRWIGLLSVLCLTLVPTYASLSAAIRTDIQQTIFVLLTVLFTVRIVRTGGTANYLIAAAMVGVGSAIKYPTAALALVIVIATAIRIAAEPYAWKGEIGRLCLAGVVSVIALFCSSPYLFLDYPQTLRDLFQEARPYHLGATSKGFLSAIVFYLTDPLAGLTMWALPLSLLGTIRILQTRDRALWILLISPVVYLTFISLYHLQWARWSAPLAPFLALFSALGVEFIYRNARHVAPPALVSTALVVLCALWLRVPALSVARSIERARATPAIAKSQSWVLQHIPPGSRIFVERYTAQLPRRVYHLYAERGRRIVRLKQTSKLVIPIGALGDLSNLNEIRTRKIEFVLLGSDYTRRRAEPAAQAAAIAKYKQFFAMAHRIGPSAIQAYKVDRRRAMADPTNAGSNGNRMQTGTIPFVGLR